MHQKPPTLLVLQSTDPERVHEALRAGLGLTLRGRPVALYAGWAEDATHLPPEDLRQVKTLLVLGGTLRRLEELDGETLFSAHAVEVWT